MNAMGYYVNGTSHQSGDVIKTEVTSDVKHVTDARSSDRGRTHHVTEVGVAEPAVELSINTPYNEEDEQQSGPSLEGELTTAKMMERRQAFSRGRMTKEQQLRVMVEQLNSKQRQLYAEELDINNVSPPTPGCRQSAPTTPSRDGSELIHPLTKTAERSVYRQSSTESAPNSPSTTWTSALQHDPHNSSYQQGHTGSQHVSPATHQNISPGGAWKHDSHGRVESSVRRDLQLEYEAGLRRYGPNYRPQQSLTDDDQFERHHQHVDHQSHGTYTLSTLALSSIHKRRSIKGLTPEPDPATTW